VTSFAGLPSVPIEAEFVPILIGLFRRSARLGKIPLKKNRHDIFFFNCNSERLYRTRLSHFDRDELEKRAALG
jgi:hypothetical protein